MVKFNTSNLLFVRKVCKESQLICRCPRNSLVIAEPASQWVEGFLKHYNVQTLSMLYLQKYLISAILDKLKQIRRRGKLHLRKDFITRILQTSLKYKICKTLGTCSQITHCNIQFDKDPKNYCQPESVLSLALLLSFSVTPDNLQ